MIIRALDIERDWLDIKQKLDISLTTETGGMVLEDKGKIVAASVFDTWTFSTVTMHMMAHSYRAVVESKFAEEVFNYIFTTCDYKHMLGAIAGDNTASLRMAKRYGFEEIHRVEEGFNEGIDLVLIKLKREDCPFWAGVENEQTESAEAA